MLPSSGLPSQLSSGFSSFLYEKVFIIIKSKAQYEKYTTKLNKKAKFRLELYPMSSYVRYENYLFKYKCNKPTFCSRMKVTIPTSSPRIQE